MIRIIIHTLILGILVTTPFLTEIIPAWYIAFSVICIGTYVMTIANCNIFGNIFGFFNTKKLKTKHGNYYYNVNPNNVIIYQEYYWILVQHSKSGYSNTQDVLEFLKNEADCINSIYDEKQNKKKIANQIKEELSTWDK